MAKSKKGSEGNTLVAASNILIEGKHFKAGQSVKGVSDEEIQKSVRIGRVVTEEQFSARGIPEFVPGEPEDDGAVDEEGAAQ